MCDDEDDLYKLIAELIVELIINSEDECNRIREDQRKRPISIFS